MKELSHIGDRDQLTAVRMPGEDQVGSRIRLVFIIVWLVVNHDDVLVWFDAGKQFFHALAGSERPVAPARDIKPAIDQFCIVFQDMHAVVTQRLFQLRCGIFDTVGISSVMISVGKPYAQRDLHPAQGLTGTDHVFLSRPVIDKIARNDQKIRVLLFNGSQVPGKSFSVKGRADMAVCNQRNSQRSEFLVRSELIVLLPDVAAEHISGGKVDDGKSQSKPSLPVDSGFFPPQPFGDPYHDTEQEEKRRNMKKDDNGVDNRGEHRGQREADCKDPEREEPSCPFSGSGDSLYRVESADAVHQIDDADDHQYDNDTEDKQPHCEIASFRPGFASILLVPCCFQAAAAFRVFSPNSSGG